MIICYFFLHSMQAGQYEEALTLVKKIIDTESKELGARPEKLADLYGLASAIYLEVYLVQFLVQWYIL